MIIDIRRILVHSFILSLEKRLNEAIEKCPNKWDKEEINWFLKDETAKHVWYSIVERKSKKYREYIKKESK